MTILATGLEDDLSNEVNKDVHHDEDDYYEDLIKLLYKSQKKVTVKEAIVQQELPFEVEPAPEPEPAVLKPEPEPESEPKMVDKLKNWLNGLMTTVTE